MGTPIQRWDVAKLKAAEMLVQGISPQRLALTLALGFVLGCIPLVGIPTALCALAALAFRLNQPAIQVANYAAMPFQLALLVPFVRLGGRFAPFGGKSSLDLGLLARSPMQLMTHSSTEVASQIGVMAGQALLGWLLLAIPFLLLLTFCLTTLLRRVPALASIQRNH